MEVLLWWPELSAGWRTFLVLSTRASAFRIPLPVYRKIKSSTLIVRCFLFYAERVGFGAGSLSILFALRTQEY